VVGTIETIVRRVPQAGNGLIHVVTVIRVVVGIIGRAVVQFSPSFFVTAALGRTLVKAWSSKRNNKF
jgi:hypothetical protein